MIFFSFLFELDEQKEQDIGEMKWWSKFCSYFMSMMWLEGGGIRYGDGESTDITSQEEW
jgi:hypothetical protein